MFLQKKKKVFPFESQEFCKHCDLKLSPQESSPPEIFSDLISDLNQWSRIEDLFTFYFQLKKSEKVATFPWPVERPIHEILIMLVMIYTGRPPRWNSPCRDEENYSPRGCTQVHQRGELNWASQLQPAGQQISISID